MYSGLQRIYSIVSINRVITTVADMSGEFRRKQNRTLLLYFFVIFVSVFVSLGMNIHENATDDELATMLTDGSEAAFDLIYERYWKKLYNEAFKRINDCAESEEIVQDVFVDLWHKRESRQIENLRGYLLGAVRYQVFAVYHKRKNLPAFEEPLDYMAFSADNADSNFLRDELLASIHQWLETQPEKRREIFRLRFLEGLSTLEIAEQLDISRKTVQNQLNTSQQSLRESIGRLLVAAILLLRP